MTALEPLSNRNPDRIEHTELGAEIGLIRDELFGKPVTDADRFTQAQANDDIAHVAADTVACLPNIRWLGAGLIRAIALNDPNCTDRAAGIAGVTASFAGGVAMNLIARSGSFGYMQHETVRRLGFGLEAEAASHFATGLQLGVVRSFTDSRQWMDDDGKFAAPDFAHVMSTGLLSGVANVPAGFLGSRVMMLGGDSALSRIANGAMSGSVSGGMFGATDGFLRTGDARQTWDGFASGVMAGAIAGGATAGAERGRQELFYALANKWREAPVDDVTAGALLAEKPLSAEAQQLLAEQPGRFAMAPDTRTLRELNAQLGDAEPGRYYEQIMHPQGPTKFWSKGQYRSNMVSSLQPTVEYTYGDTRITLPAKYAQQLEPVRALRLAAESGDTNAAAQLSQHPLGKRLLPEDMLPLLDRLPDRSKVEEVQLLGHENAWNGWFQEFTDYGRVISANGTPFRATADAALYSSKVRFFAPAAREGGTRDFRQVMDHEQVHLNHDPMYSLARRLDAPVEAHKYGYANVKESEAELESHTFWGAPETFLAATEQAPIRMSLLARKLEGTLNNSSSDGGTQNAALRERIDCVLEHAVPVANAKLVEASRDKTGTVRLSDVSALYQRINGTMDDAMFNRRVAEQERE